MNSETYDFTDRPLYVIATKIPTPEQDKGDRQNLSGYKAKTTPLILANEPNILKYLTIEKDGQISEVRQLLGGISIVSRDTLVSVIIDLLNWAENPELQKVSFYEVKEQAEEVRSKLVDAQNRYYSGIIEDAKKTVYQMKLEVIDFSKYMADNVQMYGNGKSIEELAYNPTQLLEKIPKKSFKSKQISFFDKNNAKSQKKLNLFKKK